MEYVRLGNSGLKITELTFGTALTIGTEQNNIDYATNLINTAWECGIRTFDTSNNYGMGAAETLLGLALKKYKRQEYVLFTKGSWPIGETPYERGLSRKHILWSLEESLKRLKMDYVDVYFAHRYDPETSMEEIVRTFAGIIQSGKARYWATSEWPVSALKECHQVCEKLNCEKPIMEQFIYSYAVRKAETNGVINFCRENNVGMMGFSPLCQGFLTGKYKDGIPKESRISKANIIKYDKTINFFNQNKEIIEHFIKICDKYNLDFTAVALQWCSRKGIYPVFGASNKKQLSDNVKSFNKNIPEYVWKELESK